MDQGSGFTPPQSDSSLQISSSSASTGAQLADRRQQQNRARSTPALPVIASATPPRPLRIADRPRSAIRQLQGGRGRGTSSGGSSDASSNTTAAKSVARCRNMCSSGRANL